MRYIVVRVVSLDHQHGDEYVLTINTDVAIAASALTNC